MTDLYLQELMKGNIPKPQNRFISRIDKEIEEKLKSEQFILNELESPDMIRAKLKYEMKKELELPEIEPRIQAAIQILEESQEFQVDLTNIRRIINQLTAKDELKDNLKTIFEISDASMDAIYKLALNKLEMSELENSLSLFILLVSLMPENADYWYRAGLLAQMSGQYAFALQFYRGCLLSDSEFIEAKILAVDCHLALGNKDKALELFNEIDDDPSLEGSITNVITKIKNHLK